MLVHAYITVMTMTNIRLNVVLLNPTEHKINPHNEIISKTFFESLRHFVLLQVTSFKETANLRYTRDAFELVCNFLPRVYSKNHIS